MVFVQALAVLAAAAIIALTWSWNRWDPLALGAIAAFAVGSDLMSVESDAKKLKFSGLALGTVLAAVRFGPAPATLIGMLAASVGWFKWREAPHYFRNNLVTFAWFPMAAGVFFGAAIRAVGVTSDDAAYFVFVLVAFVVAMVVNFAGVVGYQSYLDRSSFLPKIRAVLVPILSAELFAAVLTVIVVYFVVQTGAIGIVLLLITLAIFQYLVGELVTSQHRAHELHRKATTDELTGLANRQSFLTAVEEQIGATPSGAPFALMLLDLDRFKEINDTLGHHYGDLLLRDLGPRLQESIGEHGTVARLGGDEFAVLPAERTDDPASLAIIATELIECVQRPVAVEHMTLEVGASVGISRYPIDGEDAHTLLRRADVAMYAAKEQHASHELYSAKLDRHSVRRLTVLTDFRRALESDEFVVHYQPIVDIGSSIPRGAEGLVRWEHPELGLLAPGDFIPIAEQSGLIGPLTRHVLERSIAQCAGWRRAGRDLTVAVNLSVRDLLDRDLPRRIERLLDEHRLAADALQVEVTESMLMSDPDRALETVVSMRDLGVRVAVDDFGTGFSSLANLKRLPINELKIDRSFISPLLNGENDLIIVRSTINLGHDLGLTVIAEGVEDELTLKRLATLGCDLAQGFHLSPPLPSDAFSSWIEQAASAATGQSARRRRALATA